MTPGEIYYADFAVVGRHPVIVVSREFLNRGDYVVVVRCTSANFPRRSQLPNCVPFLAGEFGFTRNTVAQGETIAPVNKQLLDPAPIGILTDEKLREVIRAVGYVMDADCEPT